MTSRRAPILVLVAAALATNGLVAQGDKPPFRPAPALAAPPWVHPLASLVIPGSGQLLAREHRGVVYLTAEALFLVRLLGFSVEARRAEDRYRDLAFTVARGAFAPTVADTVWDYYEQMEKFIESGPFDTDPGPGLAPPTDDRTYNGSIWALARRTFFTNPDSIPDAESEEYARALTFYLERAVGPNFEWSWRNAGLEQDLFRQSVRQSDEAFRQLTQQLGLLLANHLLSAVDAFVSARLERNHRPVAIRAGAWPSGRRGGATWWAAASVAF